MPNELSKSFLRRSRTSAFTLLELLLVIAIISVLAGLVIFNLRPAAVLQNTNAVKEQEVSNQIEKSNAELNDSYTQIFKTYNDLKYLLNPGRTILLEFLEKKGELAVSELVEMTKMSQSIISQNLSVLKNLGVVTNRIEGRKSIYCLDKATLDRYEKLIVKYF